MVFLTSKCQRGLLALAFVFASLMAQAKSDAKSTAAAPRAALSVQLVTPQTSTVAQQIQANGNIMAWQEASVGAEMTGRVKAVNVQVGDYVRKYQVLAVFSSDIASAAIGTLRAQAAEAEAAYQDAKRNSERIRKLEKAGFMGAQMSGQYYTAEMTARARRDAAKAALAADELRLSNASVRATDDGIISRNNVVVGSLVPTGTEMFRLIKKGRLEWRAQVTATELAFIKPGMSAKVDLGNGQSVQGRVRLIAPTVDVQTRAGTVYIDLPRHPQARAGMYASGSIATGSTTALLLPQSAIVLRDGFNYVMKVGADARVQQTQVQLGRQQGNMVEVRAGVLATERVVASGGTFLADGDVVRVIGMVPAAAAGVAKKP